MARVLKPFPYSRDGFTIEAVAEGDELDFGDLEAGLIEAGLISKAAPVEKPDEPTAGKPRGKKD